MLTEVENDALLVREANTWWNLLILIILFSLINNNVIQVKKRSFCSILACSNIVDVNIDAREEAILLSCDFTSHLQLLHDL